MRLNAFLCRLIIFVMFPIALVAQKGLVRGEIIDSVKIEGSDETFSLYLPTFFDGETLSSIVFVFDPAARGTMGVTTFTEVSEKYGHIIVCSNNSKNGPVDKNFEIANRLFAHIFNNFNIDEKQMFLAGFSGGSRLASSIATLTNKFSGVIACGAGFSSDVTYTPSFQDFMYAGICGNEDMNFQEMRTNKRILDQLQFKNTLFTFNGGHQWPPSTEIDRAFRWIHTMKNNEKEGALKEVLAVELKETQALNDSEEFLLAGENYERILDVFKDLDGHSAVQKEFESLLRSKEYKNALKEQQRALELETSISKKLYDRFFVDFENPENADMSWWSKEFQKLEKIIAEGPSQKSKMAKRVQFKIFAAAFSRGNPNLFSSTEAQLAYCGKLKQLIYPK